MASPVDHLTAGRRSLRRRRGAVALAATAAVAALGTVTLVGLDGVGPGTTSGIPAAAQGADPSPTPSEPPHVPADPAPAGHTVHDVWLDDGVLSIGSAVEVLQRIDDPLHLDEPSYALDVIIKSKQLHLLLVGDEVVEEPAKAAIDGAPTPPGFEQWLAGTTTSPGGRLQLALVEFGDEGSLEPVAPTRSVVEQTTEVDLPRRSAGPDDLVAAAAVDFAGERWFVLGHQAPGESADYLVLPRDETVRDLTEFVSLVEDRYTSGALG